MRNYSSLFLFTVLISCKAKVNPDRIPITISNNAIASVDVDGRDYIYSFGGIGNSKDHSDITLRSFKYSVDENVWEEISPLPDTMPKIASAASVINGIIYIVGGYHVFPDGHEKSSSKVHRYDPVEDRFLEDAPNLPTPIDDHVQAVWQDSLLYVITGWSDSLNVSTVQVFDADGHWHYATPVPEEPAYRVFGSSGVIVENDIYFSGGAGNRSEGNFPVQHSLKIGHIDPENPLSIQWESIADSLAGIYRPGAIVINGNPYWIGGSSRSYNYNGIAYTGHEVDPLSSAIFFDRKDGSLKISNMTVPLVMDLRGIAQLSSEEVAVVGGMLPGQVVSDRVFIITISAE